ncbi:MAG: translation initiation factor 2 [Desulfovibrio sp.]|jgi:hypothetical protein|nr:translation initiation factor 2 [Desulfovibrio sp.]
MKGFVRCCCIVMLLLAWTGLARAALSVSKPMAAYARDMEYFYVEKRQEALPGIVRSFDAAGVLRDAGKRMMLAAFIAEVMVQYPGTRTRFYPPPVRSQQVDAVIAWAAHLAQLSDAEAVSRNLLEGRDALRRQIASSPAPLTKWNILSEPTVLHMFWGAYFVGADNRYLDPIIEACLRFADLTASGRRNDPGFEAGREAAATLFDFAPRHKKVQERLRHFLERTSGARAETLQTILR